MDYYWNSGISKTKIILGVILSVFFLIDSCFAQTSKVSIILDDTGYVREVEHAKDIPCPITFAVFPRFEQSALAARLAFEQGFEVIIHMPMEAIIGTFDPGPGAIYVRMTDAEIKKILDENIKTVPFAVGINNHMGSRVTQDVRCMRVIMSEVKKRGMLFIDSVTDVTVCEQVSKEVGLPYIARDVFLDNEQNPEYIKNQLIELMNVAKKNGKAVGIGHSNRKYTIECIREMVPIMKQNGIVFCYASEIGAIEDYKAKEEQKEVSLQGVLIPKVSDDAANRLSQKSNSSKEKSLSAKADNPGMENHPAQ